MLEVILDTNVLVAALRSSLGASYRLLHTLERRVWQPGDLAGAGGRIRGRIETHRHGRWPDAGRHR